MRYDAYQQYQADSPYQGRALGSRHRGGGSMANMKGGKQGPMGDFRAGFAQDPAGSLNLPGGQSMPTGSLYRSDGVTEATARALGPASRRSPKGGK